MTAPAAFRALADAVAGLMQRVGCPTSLQEVGHAEADLPGLVRGELLQQRLLAVAPLPVDEALLERVFRDSL